MAKSATLNIRTDPAVKAQAEAIYQRFGITLTDAVNIFLRKSIMDGGLPFDMRQPNAETFSAILEAEDIIAGRAKAKEYASAGALFDELDAEEEGGAERRLGPSASTGSPGRTRRAERDGRSS